MFEATKLLNFLKEYTSSTRLLNPPQDSRLELIKEVSVWHLLQSSLLGPEAC